MTLKQKCETLIDKWNEEVKKFESRYQFGKCGTDDMSMNHGRYDQLLECIEDFEIVLKK